MSAANRPKRFRSRRYRSWKATIYACLFFGLTPVSADAFDIVLGTGEVESFSHFAGRIVCRAINRHAPDLRCQVQPAEDEMDNLTNLQGGSLDIGLVDARMLHDAVHKSGYFKFLDLSYDHLRALLPLYDTPFALVVRSDAAIASLDGLKGKRINAGAPRSRRHLAVETIMKAKGWSADDFSLFAELPASHSQDTMAFCHGKVQAMVTLGVHPEPSVEQLFELCKAEIVDLYDDDIDKLVKDHPAFRQFDIAAGTYPRQPDAVRTFGTRVLLVASDSLDEQTVFQVMEAIGGYRERLKAAHPALAAYAGSISWKDAMVIPLHTGAEKYFSEN